MNEDIKAQLTDATGDSSAPSAAEPVVQPGTDAGTGSGSTVSLEAFNEVLTRLKETNTQLDGLKDGMAFVAKVKQVLTDDSKGQVNPRDKMVLDELHRLIPELSYLKNVPDMIKEVQKTMAENQSGAADAAWTTQQSLQKEFKVGDGDPEVSKMLGVQIREWITEDRGRQRRFANGDTGLIKEGFEHVVGKLYGPERLAKKRAAVARAASLPTIPGARGGGGTSSETPSINFKQAPSLVKRDVRGALKSFAQSMGRDAE